MKQLNLLKTMFLLCALIVGSNAWADETGTISFGNASGSTAVNGTSVKGDDSQGNEWTITTVMTQTSFTQNALYSQIGSSSKPATSITFTTTLPNEVNITSFSAKFGGFSGTAGTVTLKVGDTTVGTGSLNGTSDVIVSNTSAAKGTVLTVTVTGISKGVKAYYISYTYSSKPNAGVSASDIDDMISGTSKTNFYTITADDYDGTLNFDSDDEAVAKVEGGVLKAIAPGTAQITITADETEKYASVDVSFNVTVKNRDAVDPAGTGAGGYSLVTDASTLQAGDQLVLVNEDDGIIMAAQADNNRRGTDVTITESKISTPLPENSAVITLEGSTGAWNFKTSDGYLYAANSSSNQMKSRAEVGDDNNATATISIADGDATITFRGSNRPRVRYNPNGGNPVFSCYTTSSTTGSLPQIYRFSASSSFDVTIGSSGWRTLISAKNVSLPEGVKAYIVTASSSSSVTLAEVASVKANEPYLLNGPAGDCTLTVIDTPAEPTGNLLQITDENTSNDVYVLSKKGEDIGFRRWTGGNLGAGRVYLIAPVNAREFIGFSDGETTGIAEVRGKMSDVRGDYFDLSGRKVAQPTKGLYIVNGKKFVIK